jgi:hypothetical protein
VCVAINTHYRSADLVVKTVIAESVIAPSPAAPSVEHVFDKYNLALGGEQRLATLTSLIAVGTSVGYGPEGEKRAFEVFARAPSQRTTITHTLDGDHITTFDGRAGWIAGPHRPVLVLALTGHDLDGLKLDADLSFPARIKEALGQWRVGSPTTIDDRDVDIVQGTGAAGPERSQRSTSTRRVACSCGKCATRSHPSAGFRRRSTTQIVVTSPESRCRSGGPSSGWTGGTLFNWMKSG